MEKNKMNNRFNIVKGFLVAVFSVIILKMVYMNIFQYDYYLELADSKTFKQVAITAARGEIKDRNGKLLAGNKNSFVVEVSSDQLTAKNNDPNRVSLDIINTLIKNKEDYVDEFPIIIDENGKYYYKYDRDVIEYKKSKEIPLDLNAKETFYYLVDSLIEKGELKESDKDLEPSELQQKLNKKSCYPPILVSSFTFTEIKDKQDWLKGYKVNENTSAKEAFQLIREYYKIDKSLSDKDARKILVVRDLVKSQGYTSYYPVTLSSDVSEETISYVEENAKSLQGISISNEPIRYYPNKNLASHVLGYVGKIPSTLLEDYLNNKEKTYRSDDIVGLAGIEKSQEENLKGIDGYKKVKVNATGKITDELEIKEPISGDTVYLTLDKDLQEVAEEGLKKTLDVAKNGGTYKSDYGDVQTSGGSKNANTGAIIAVDVETGEVLASASYPDYDPNVFATGISSKDFEALRPKNENDLLAGSPLLNLVTQGVFQPGSTFKMITGMAALENGLSPYYTINDKGVIWLNGQSYGDAIWNKSKSNHGMVNLYKAIQESCNIYFYTIGSGTKNKAVTGYDPKIDMNSDKILEYAKLFGLDENTGLQDEIEESAAGKVPSEEDKIDSTKSLLESYLRTNVLDSFTDVKESDDEGIDKKIETILTWVDETPVPSRGEMIQRLTDLNVKEDEVEGIADDILFSYLKFARWTISDNFNLAIGQGENAYTPAQMSRYIMAIANGGYLTDLTLTKKVIDSDYQIKEESSVVSKKIDFKDSDHLKDLIQGMKQVVTEGTASKYFKGFPFEVAAKSGTAEKNSKIPTKNEYEYLMSHLSSYGVNKKEVMKVYQELRDDREKELTKNKIKEINEQLKDKNLDEETRKELEKELEDGVDEKLAHSDKIDAAYLRRAIKKVKPSITDDDIDRFKETYGDFGWGVAFAPADDPEIAVVCVIPQGNTSTYAFLPIKDVIGKYMDVRMDSPSNEKEDENDNNDDSLSNDNEINFGVQIKK